VNDNTNQAQTVEQGGTKISVPDGFYAGGGVLGVATTLVVLALGLRKRLSRDNLELTKDRAETDLIASLHSTIKSLNENNTKLDQNAREAWSTRAADAKQIGELSSKVEYLTRANQELREENTLLRASVESMRGQLNQMYQMMRQMVPESNRAAFDQNLNQQSTIILEPENATLENAATRV
jgi:hypothetical protein